MEHKIVVHTQDGTIHKGVTHDFDPAEKSFHLLPGEGGGVPIRLALDDLKALFYVKDYLGNRHFVASRSFEGIEGKRAVVTFHDGEEIWGTVSDGFDDEAGQGFFLIPADKEDNNLRIFVVRSAMKDLRLES